MEILKQGSSNLDERLEIFKDKQGDIKLTPGQAKEVLLMTLIEYYQDSVKEVSPKVEALLEIMTTQERNGKLNYTDLLVRITSKREENKKRRDSVEIASKIFSNLEGL